MFSMTRFLAIPLLAASAAALLPASPTSAQSTVWHAVTVKRFSGFSAPNVTDARVDKCLTDASNIILTDSDGASTNDAACNTQLVRSGAVGSFSVTDGDIDTPAEMGLAQGNAGFIKIVKTISYCTGTGTGTGTGVVGVIAGCTQKNAFNGSVFAEVAFSSTACGKIVAHEFGHSIGFGDLFDSQVKADGLKNVMRQGGDTSFTHLLSGQCPFLRADCVDHDGPGGTAPTNGCVSPVVGPNVEDRTLEGVSIQSLVAEGLGHRVPIEALNHYSQEDARVLQKWLGDAAQFENLAAAARLLGLVGTDVDENAKAPIQFAEKGPDDASAKAAAVISLGYLANRGSASALDYLVKSADRTDSDIADWAVSALAVSGNDRAKTELTRIHADADAPRARLKRHGRAPELIALARNHHALIQRGGLKAYYATQ
ncbi:MAG: hypothetical protein RL385_5271 [Pseudomonadota bacterium]